MGKGTVATTSSTPAPGSSTREDVLRTLYNDSKHFQMWAVCPHGRKGPMLYRFLYGTSPTRPLSFTDNEPCCQHVPPIPPNLRSAWHPSACKCSVVIIQTCQQLCHSCTAPTPQIHFLQQFGQPAPRPSPFTYVPTQPEHNPQASPGPARAPPGLTYLSLSTLGHRE
eukprot:scaffold2540_cov154-Skeletonema_menzelii.AAC.2